jgi:hypothetical protein
MPVAGDIRAGAKRLSPDEVAEFDAMVDGVIFAVEREAGLSQQRGD